MLEGLEISEVDYSKFEIENRFDSEYFRRAFVENERYLRNSPHFLLGEHFYATDGEHGSVIEQDSGVKYLTAENIKKVTLIYLMLDISTRVSIKRMHGLELLLMMFLFL